MVLFRVIVFNQGFPVRPEELDKVSSGIRLSTIALIRSGHENFSQLLSLAL
jgi:hypothetical protein